MITINQALEIHHILVKKFGGGNGIRDMRGLEAALERPFMTFDGQE